MIKHVSVAINKLRNRTKYRSLKFVTDEQTDLINDSTWFSERQAKDRDQLNMLLAQNNLIKYFFKTKIFLKKTRLYRSLHYLYSKDLFLSKKIFFLKKKRDLIIISSIKSESLNLTTN